MLVMLKSDVKKVNKQSKLCLDYAIESECQEIQEFFNIDNWSFNQPINISELELIIANVEGVQSVPKCEIVNKCGGTYSNVKYNISDATKNKQVYPSLDPSVFELKYANKDIKGRVV